MSSNSDFKISNRKKLTVNQLQDIKLPIRLILGETKLKVRELLELKPGKIINLNRLAGETVDFLVNDKIIAKGEVVVIDNSFGARLVTLLSQEERLKRL